MRITVREKNAEAKLGAATSNRPLSVSMGADFVWGETEEIQAAAASARRFIAADRRLLDSKTQEVGSLAAKLIYPFNRMASGVEMTEAGSLPLNGGVGF